MAVKINYELNGGVWAPKDEVKEAFYTDLYHFVNENYDTDLKSMPLADFINSEPYIIGNMVGKYYLKEEIGGKVEDQPTDYFIGYCYHNNKYKELIPHLIEFFALWRIIEGCIEPHADDFFASSWASLVDTAKFFKYTTVEDLEKSPESPTVRVDRILNKLQNCPGVYLPPYEVNPKENQRLAKPRRDGYEFVGWYDNPDFKGEPVKEISKDLKKDVTFYARWATHTIFHSNDGYATFEDLYSDFLKDFSLVVGEVVTKDVERTKEHGPISDFCKVTYRNKGSLNKFFSITEYHNKWWWLIDYVRTVKKRDPQELSFFDYENGQFKEEAQVRWELNSLFVSRFHLTWPKTADYSGAGIKEKLADSTNSQIIKVRYIVGDEVKFPVVTRNGYKFSGWYDNYKGLGKEIKHINDDTYASKTLYAKWTKLN
ncbi:MAG TPA: InlB B-repeat-containing protein [Bacilli bacterium]